MLLHISLVIYDDDDDNELREKHNITYSMQILKKISSLKAPVLSRKTLKLIRYGLNRDFTLALHRSVATRVDRFIPCPSIDGFHYNILPVYFLFFVRRDVSTIFTAIRFHL